MCGPLAIAFTNRPGASKMQVASSALSYNIGRTFTYAGIGLLFGTLGSVMVLSDFQKVLSILLGITLVLSSLFGFSVSKRLFNSLHLSKIYSKYQLLVQNLIVRSKDHHPFTLGLFNGLLPCGLVYVALAGALASGSTILGVLFMTLFGLGTLPLMFSLSFGYKIIPAGVKSRLQNALPFISLIFGLFLIYRGIVVDMPRELNFWMAIKNPIMCH
jgi:sulfite exporter TauE/SafE